jgi:hypothetical protein
VLKPDGCPARRGEPSIAPGSEGHEDRNEFRAGLGQGVLEARRTLVVLPSLEDPVFLEIFEAGRQEVPRDPEVLDDLVESANSYRDVSDDQGCPPVTHDLQALGKRAVEVGEARAAHAAYRSLTVAALNVLE